MVLKSLEALGPNTDTAWPAASNRQAETRCRSTTARYRGLIMVQMRSRLLLLAAAVLFSTGGAAIKATALNGWQVASFRSAVATVALYAALPEARRGWRLRTLPVSLAYAGTLLLFVLATKLTTAASAIFLQGTAPLYVLLLGPLLLGETVRRGDFAFIAAVAAGMSMFFLGTERPLATAPDPGLGNWLAAGSGITWALTVMGLRWVGCHRETQDSAMAAVAVGNLCACLMALPAALPVARVAVADGLVIGYLGVVQIGLAYLCLTAGLRRVPAFEAAALMLAEPALNPVWAWAVHGEKPGPWALAGGATILAASALQTWLRR